MARLGDPALHFYMTRGIARLLDVNLSDALREGRLSPDRYARMVTLCRSCDHAERCKALLAHTTHLASPPAHCPNETAFQSLRVH